MNWRLIFLLSLFGLAMSYLTVSILDSNTENIAWGVICLFYGFMVARFCNGNYFFNGFMISIFNCVWVTGMHLIFYSDYIDHHKEMVLKMDWFHMQPDNGRLEMILIGPIIGITFGIVVGGLSWIFSKIMKKAPAASNA